ncbi:MAG: PilZ domain-containing protein [Pseudomonadota bacterium]
MSKSTLQHFVSKNQLSSSKGITLEQVKKNSESSRFLKRVNLPEHQQPCYKPLDMRGKAPGPHRKIAYNDRIFYLDDLSFLIFQQGLKDNKNIFTMGTYHKIFYGKHSYMGQDAQKPENQKNHGLNLLLNDQKRVSIKDDTQHENIIGIYAPDILPLGYSSKRKENRLVYVMPISLTYKGKLFQVKSRDFSINGVKIFLPRTLFISGNTVKLSFDLFIEKQKELTDSSSVRFFLDIFYKIIDVRHINDKTYVSLIQLDLNDYAKQVFSQFIDSNRVQYKLDTADILIAARARYVEHLYTHNLSSIPLFLSYNPQQNQYSINNIIQTSNNQNLLDFFKSPAASTTNYNFSPFILAHRLEYFAGLAFENTNALLFVFWENDKIYSLCDFEFSNKTDLASIALKIMAQKGKIFSLNSKQLKKPEPSRVTSIINNLLSLEKNLAEDILTQTASFMAQLVLTDITEVFQYESYFSLYSNKEEAQITSVPVYCENQKLNLAKLEMAVEKQLKITKKPKKISLNVHKIRYIPRYICAISVHLNIKNKALKAETIDFSQNGIGVKLAKDNTFKIEKNKDVLVSFPSFANKVSDINFNDVHYKIVRVIEHGDFIELGLVRIVEAKNKAVGLFFNQLINRNKSKLGICINDRIEYTLEHLMEAYIDSNINSIPLLISRDKQQGRHLKYVGLAEVACKLAEHFFLKLRGYNFKILTSDERLEQLYIRSLRGKNKGQSFILFMYKDINEQGSEYINSFTSFEIVYQGETLNLLAKLFENNGVCIKLSFMDTMVSDPLEIEKIYDMISSVNRQHASLFKHELADVVGLVDMVDVTTAYRSIYELQQ